MRRTSEQKLSPSLSKQIKKIFAQTLTDFKDQEETEKFLSHFFTSAELEVFAKRLAIAYWLKKKRSYVNIKNNLKVSSATIAAVQVMSAKEGFKMGVKKIEAEEWANQWAERIKKFVK
jgi:uncharacterized protein YerC